MPEIGTRCIKGKRKSPKKEWTSANELYFCHSNDFTNEHMYFLPYSKPCQAKPGPALTLHVELFWESCLVLLALISLALQCYYTTGQSFLLCTDLIWDQKEDLSEKTVIFSDRTHRACTCLWLIVLWSRKDITSHYKFPVEGPLVRKILINRRYANTSLLNLMLWLSLLLPRLVSALLLLKKKAFLTQLQ